MQSGAMKWRRHCVGRCARRRGDHAAARLDAGDPLSRTLATVRYILYTCTVQSVAKNVSPPLQNSSQLLCFIMMPLNLGLETSLGLLDLVVLLRMSATYLSEP